jgi:hypothetical protein
VVGIWSINAWSWKVDLSTVRVHEDSRRERRSRAIVCDDQFRGCEITRATYGDICSEVRAPPFAMAHAQQQLFQAAEHQIQQMQVAHHSQGPGFHWYEAAEWSV